MAASQEVLYLHDFSGGLNLTTQQQSLALNESPDCLNVDFGYRGGFVLRGGFQSQEYDTSLNGAIFLCPTYFANDVVLLADANGGLRTWNGSTLVNQLADLSDVTMTTAPIRAASFDSKAYFANGRLSGNLIMRSWDGTTLANLTNTFNDEYTMPNQGDMPLARHVANHNGYMWVADTVESAVRYPHRIRFSHLYQPEDWAAADYFDVDPGDDGDPITAIVPFKDRLVVFKRSTVWAVYGYRRDDFFVERISTKSGVNDPRATTSNSNVLYWMASDGNVMAYNGSSVAPLSDAFRWWTDIGKINSAGQHDIMFSDGRLYFSLEAGAGESVDRWLFVYEPSVKAMTRYDKQVTAMIHWERLDIEHDSLFLMASDSNLYRFDRAYNVDKIDAGAGPVSTRISGYYKTSWITANETATKKRWKRPRITAAADDDATITIDVYHDFDQNNVQKTSSFSIVGGTASLWGTMVWGDPWGVDDEDFYKFSRQPSAGTGYSVQFKFSSNNNLGRWWVDSLALPFRRKQVK